MRSWVHLQWGTSRGAVGGSRKPQAPTRRLGCTRMLRSGCQRQVAERRLAGLSRSPAPRSSPLQRPPPLPAGAPLPVQVVVPHLLPGVVGQARPALEPGGGHLPPQRLPPLGRLVGARQDVLAAAGGAGRGGAGWWWVLQVWMWEWVRAACRGGHSQARHASHPCANCRRTELGCCTPTRPSPTGAVHPALLSRPALPAHLNRRGRTSLPRMRPGKLQIATARCAPRK